MRMGTQAEENANLRKDAVLYDQKLTKKTQYINELKEINREQREEFEDTTKLNETKLKKLEVQVNYLNE